MMRAAFALFIALCCFFSPATANAQRQLPDNDFSFRNDNPAYAAGAGPRIVFVTANSKFVLRGAFDPLARLAETDGFRVSRPEGTVEQSMAGADILVIANPFLENYRDYPAMTPPSAFSVEEIDAIRRFVEEGGALLLLADHAPLGGGSSDLAKAFGFEFLNGHTAEAAAADIGNRHVMILFTPDNGLLTSHPITSGDTGRQKITRFQAFGGQSFIPPADATNLLTIPSGWVAIFTYRLEAELASAPRIDASGMSQGAIMDYGKGRLAVFAEAGGFSAQIIDGVDKFGFNTPEGAANPEFILATLRWLARFEPASR
jgi:hypothetical protein